MRHTIRLFGYLTIDHKAAQEALNRMAEKGWQLRGIYGGILALFVRTQRRDLRYFVDLTDPIYTEAPDYLSLCADAGWEEAALVRYMRVYRSRPGPAPAPIQTDSGVEYARFRSLALRRMFFSGGLLLALALVLLFTILAFGGAHPWGGLCKLLISSHIISALLLSLPVLVPLLLCYLFLLLSRLRTWRKCAREGEPFPVTSSRAALAGSLFALLANLWLLLLLLSMALDYATGDNRNATLLGLLLGTVIGLFLLRVFKSEMPRRRFPKWYANPILQAALLVLLLRLLPLSPQALVFHDGPPPPIAGEVAGYNICGSWLGSHDDWRERDYTYFVDRYTCRFSWLADGIEASLPEARGEIIRHGNTVLQIHCPDDDPLLLPRVEAWLEGEPGPIH